MQDPFRQSLFRVLIHRQMFYKKVLILLFLFIYFFFTDFQTGLRAFLNSAAAYLTCLCVKITSLCLWLWGGPGKVGSIVELNLPNLILLSKHCVIPNVQVCVWSRKHHELFCLCMMWERVTCHPGGLYLCVCDSVSYCKVPGSSSIWCSGLRYYARWCRWQRKPPLIADLLID